MATRPCLDGKAYVQNSGLSLGLLELMKVRVSQINGCAFCIAMHVPLARKHGISERPIATSRRLARSADL